MNLLDVTDNISRGSILRFPPNLQGYGDLVDLMVCYDGSLHLVITTGFKAGHVIASIPADGLTEGTVMISASWLKANWQGWVWEQTPADEVELFPHYPEPTR